MIVNRFSSFHPFLKTCTVFAAAGFFSLAAFLLRFDARIVDPRNIAWLMAKPGDYPVAFLGWHFFRFEAWQFPLGRISHYFYPVGTTIGYTDSVPFLAIPFKLAGGFLPLDFQYLGIWLLACYILQGIFAVLLMRTATSRAMLQALGAAFFIFSPVLLYRAFHLTLNGHWLLLSSLWLYIASIRKEGARRYLSAHFLLVLFSVFVHPYFTAMLVPVFFAHLDRVFFFEKRLTGKQAVSLALFSLGGLAVIGYVLGYIQPAAASENAAGGFGYYSLNLNALFNSLGNSPLVPPLPLAFAGQYEGYSYLGLGLLALLLYCLLLLLRKRNTVDPSFYPLGAALLILTIYAMGNSITLGGRVILHYPLGNSLRELAGIFRADGRFFWLPYYAIVYAVLRTVVHRRQWQQTAVLLALALMLQLYDCSSFFSMRVAAPPRTCDWMTLGRGKWNVVLSRFKKIVFYPPLRRSYNAADDYRYFAYLAAARGVAVGAGHVGRDINVPIAAITKGIEGAFLSGAMDEDTVYVINRDFDHVFFAAARKSSRCYLIDDYLVCYSDRLPPLPFGEALAGSGRENVNDFIINNRKNILVLVGAVDALPAAFITHALKLGASPAMLGGRGFYAALMTKTALVYEAGAETSLSVDLSEEGLKDRLVMKKPITIAAAKDTASIRIGGREYAPAHQHVNVVALDKDFNRVDLFSVDGRVLHFCTHK
jgi:hypothetical protein